MPQIDRRGAICDRSAGLLHPDEPPSQRLVHQLLEGLIDRPPEVLDPGRYVVVERKSRSDASHHEHY